MNEVVPIRPQEIPAAPDHLSPAARSWWDAIALEYVLDSRSAVILEAALEHWDRYREAKALLDGEGIVVTNPDSGHVHAHPAHGIARDAIREFRQLWRTLGLAEPGGDR